MPNVLIATAPAEGHINPVLEVARELAVRGHHVLWYTGEAYRERITRTGSRFAPMRRAFDFGGRSRLEAFPRHADLGRFASITVGLREIFYDPAPDVLADLLDLHTGFAADAVLTDDMCYGGSFFAERTGLPLAWITNGMYLLSSRDTAPLGLGLPPSATALGRLRNAALKTITDRVVMRAMRRAADRTRAKAGLAPLPGGAFENVVRLPDLYLLGTVPSFEYPRSDLLPQAHFVGALLGRATEEFTTPSWWAELDEARSVVHITQGTTTDDADRLLKPAIRALAEVDTLVVVTTGRTAADPLGSMTLPGNVRLERFLPYQHLLPRLDAMVTNGGYNGANAALANGVPLVVAPGSEEKGEAAARVVWAGAGLAIGRRRLSESAIRDAVRTVLDDPRYRAAARAIRDENRRYDAPVRSADLIERLVRTGRPVLAAAEP